MVTATAVPAEAPVGAVVSAVDGVPAAQRLADAMRLASGTTQWKQTRALQEIGSCPTGAAVKLVIDTGAGPQPSEPDVRGEAASGGEASGAGHRIDVRHLVRRPDAGAHA